jgi:hypothetical protein
MKCRAANSARAGAQHQLDDDGRDLAGHTRSDRCGALAARPRPRRPGSTLSDPVSTRVRHRDRREADARAAANSFDNDPEPLMISDSVISGNLATVSSRAGSATVQGVGIFTNTQLELRDVQVSGNIGRATGADALAQGGGI